MAPGDVLGFWFAPGMEGRWFRSTPALDDAIRTRFGGFVDAAASGDLDPWADTADGALALVIVLDQLPLHIYRGQPRAFAAAERAIAVCRRAVTDGVDADLARERRAFLYMPLMHSEDLADQDLAVALFERAGLDDNLRFARHHRELIRRFGRFPHRNAILGRASSDAELAYLASKEAFTG